MTVDLLSAKSDTKCYMHATVIMKSLRRVEEDDGGDAGGASEISLDLPDSPLPAPR